MHRRGEEVTLRYRLHQRRPLVPVLHGVDCVPSYLIVGGLVFVPLSIPFLEHAYGGARAHSRAWPVSALRLACRLWGRACVATAGTDAHVTNDACLSWKPASVCAQSLALAMSQE